MNNPAPVPDLGPDDLFVIACPICRGHVAATGGLYGRDACCPLCANLFHVPFPATPPATAAPEPSLAEDWVGVIEQLAPPPKHPLPKPPPVAAAADEVTEATPAATAPALPALNDAFDLHDEIAAVETVETNRLVTGEPGSELVVIEPVIEPVIEASVATPFAGPAPGPSDQPAVDVASLPQTEPTPLDPAAADLVFREPVRTIRQGNTVIEIRRLTPEERRTRRFRRNLMMIVVGVSILLVIVLLFGVPKK